MSFLCLDVTPEGRERAVSAFMTYQDPDKHLSLRMKDGEIFGLPHMGCMSSRNHHVITAPSLFSKIERRMGLTRGTS